MQLFFIRICLQKSQQGKEELNKKGEIKNHLKETLVNLGGASLVNAAIQIMSYYAFYLKGLTNITSLESAYYTLAPLFGALASWIFAISLFSSGLSSSMVSVIAGVKILESYFGTPTKQWKVRLMLRLINMVPFLIAVYLGVDMMSILVYTQAILSFSLPLVLFPLINISKDGNLMGGYKISKPLYVISLVSTVFIVLINIAMFVF
ncbi:divalent metal cation transporter [Fervidicoccus fontis]|uniref:divalent metal cation transporter n=1 Tax=Fervidicoccus fontis TaxID=683846 RepID=UPI0011E57940|nr:divalent metal cation transporter [Fervidicoccus fontis]